MTEDELRIMIDSYYAARGWTADGLIPSAKLEALGLGDIARMWAWRSNPPSKGACRSHSGEGRISVTSSDRVGRPWIPATACGNDSCVCRSHLLRPAS